MTDARPARRPRPSRRARPLAAAAGLLAAGVLAAGLLATGPAGAADETAVRDARTFCTANADVAAAIGRELQIRRLILAERRIDDRIKALEEATRRTRAWLDRRDALLAAADAQVVAIYAKMRPEAAASQIANLTRDVAVAVVMKLPARAVGPIMAEMEPAEAAALAAAVAELRADDEPAPGDRS